MATKETIDFLSRITRWADDLAEVEKESRDLNKIYANLGLDSITDQNILDFGMSFTAAELTSARNNLDDVTNFHDNVAVTAADRRSIFNKIRNFGSRR